MTDWNSETARRLATIHLRNCAGLLRDARSACDCGPSLKAWFFLELAAASWEMRKLLEAILVL